MDWTRDISDRLRRIAATIDQDGAPSASGTIELLEGVHGRVAFLDKVIREEWTLMELDYDPSAAMGEFQEAIGELGATVEDEGPDHLKMNVPRGREDDLRKLSEEMARGRHGPELEGFAKAYGAG